MYAESGSLEVPSGQCSLSGLINANERLEDEEDEGHFKRRDPGSTGNEAVNDFARHRALPLGADTHTGVHRSSSEK